MVKAKHDHEHSGHSHEAPTTGTAFALGIGLNLAFVVIESVYGALSGSMALVADAAHNLSDVLGLFLAWGALVLAKRKPSRRHTYGLRKSTVLSALANAVLIFVAVGGVAWEAIGRFLQPRPVAGLTVAIVAMIGVAINAGSALLFAKSKEHDVNVKAAFLHLASDALVSLAVVLTGLVILKTGVRWLDPAVSLLVSMVIAVSTWRLLKNALNLALDAVPDHIDAENVRMYLARIDGVVEVHDLHIWPMSTTEVALTAHLVIDESAGIPIAVRQIADELNVRFKIEHVTLQIDPPRDAKACRLASDEVV